MSVRQNCFCAFCRNPRRVYRKKHISSINIVLVAILASSSTWALSQSWHPILLVFLAIGLVACEIFIQFRWRLSISCPHCGFDPLLYLRDPNAAAKQVSAFVAEKRQEPESVLRQDPLRHLRARQ